MDEKDIQTFDTTFAVESAKKTAELGKEVAEDVIRPSSKSIGNNLGKLAEGVFGWLGVWGEKQKIKQQQNLEKFKKDMSSAINQIPEENLKEPTMSIVGPAIEASKYYYDEDYFREMFAKLIAGTCDNRLSDTISPYFVDAIKQMTQQDALVLSSFKKVNQQAIVNYSYKLKNNGGKIRCFNYVFYLGNEDEHPETNSNSIVNLERLGFISVDYSSHLVDSSNYQRYTNDFIYMSLKQSTKQKGSQQNLLYEDAIIDKGVVSLTPLGRNFINICL